VIELQDVHMEKGDHTILDRVSWSVRQGQCWALKGLNGAGKSSIVKLITVRPPGTAKTEGPREVMPHTPA
jgi:molybdate transport system ATP-binding protein